MNLARSKITAQGQISVPAKVRQKLGVGPGSVLVWDEEQGRVMVSRAGTYTFEDINTVLFPEGPPRRRSLKEIREGIREHIRLSYESD